MVVESHRQQQQQQQQQNQQQQQQQQHSSRLGLRNTTGGEIVEVQGGHIVRSTGRKDRHSKVCTAKGPRDRRVRLSAHTAIQFYDVQDRLGYDRPSKAVDWLIKKAKAAIDELAELPAWQPTATNTAAQQQPDHGDGEDEEEKQHAHVHSHHQQRRGDADAAGKKPMQAEPSSDSAYGFQPLNNPTSFLPPSLDSDAIADTIKSFFPMASSSSSIHFQHYPPDLLSRTSSQNQDLRLSLQSLQDPILLQQHQQQQQHHTHQHHHHHPPPSAGEQALFTSTAPLSFDPSPAGWPDQQQQEMGRFQRMIAWNAAEAGGSGGGYVFNAPPPSMSLLGQNPLFPQRGPLQSSSSPSVRAWTDPLQIAVSHQMAMLHHPPSSISPIGFASGGFSGFRIPARIQGEEEHDAVANKPSSTSSAPRH